MDISFRLVDCTHGIPAAGVPVRLDLRIDNAWRAGPRQETSRTGRLDGVCLLPPAAARPDRYRLVVEIGGYFAQFGVGTCHPEIVVVFGPLDPARQHHVEVAASAYGYSTLWTNE